MRMGMLLKKRILLLFICSCFFCMRDGHGMLLEPQKKLGSLRTSLTDLHGRLGLLKEKLTCLKQNSVIGTLEGWAQRCFLLPEFTQSIHGNRIIYSFAYKIPEITQAVFERALNAVIAINAKKIPTSTTVIQKSALTDGDTIILCGDIHGSIHALMRILRSMKQFGYIGDDFKVIGKTKIVFLGDYEDRGRYGVEVLFTLAYLKIQNEDSIILLRGNHDGNDVTSEQFGFRYELAKKMGIDSANIEGVTSDINNKICKALPVIALCLTKDNTRERIFCCHGCIPCTLNEPFKGDLERPSDFIPRSSTDEIGINIQSTYCYTPTPEQLIASLQYYGIKAQFNGHTHGDRALTIFDTSAPKDTRGFFSRKPYVAYQDFQLMSSYLTTIPVYTLSNCPEFTTGEGYAIIRVNKSYENWTMKIVDLTEKNDENYKKLSTFLGASVRIDRDSYHWEEPCFYDFLKLFHEAISTVKFQEVDPIKGLDLLMDYVIDGGKSTPYPVSMMSTYTYKPFLNKIKEKIAQHSPLSPVIMAKVRTVLRGLDAFGGEWVNENTARKVKVDTFKDGVKAVLRRALGE